MNRVLPEFRRQLVMERNGAIAAITVPEVKAQRARPVRRPTVWVAGVVVAFARALFGLPRPTWGENFPKRGFAL